jgi:uncharacterized hydrophobic protein (TIGR00271 family)
MKENQTESSENEERTAQDRPTDTGEGQVQQLKGCEGFGHLVVVPIPLETSLQPLIDLALSFACPKDGRVVALLLAMGEPEEHAHRLHQIAPIIQSMREDGRPVELAVHSSISITRGVLDATRELRADLLVLDARLPAEGGTKLGTIVENIVPVSPCPVVLYRPGESASIGRIVVPILEGRKASSASQLATALGQRLDKPVEALFLEIESSEQAPAYWDKTKRMDAVFSDQSGGARVAQTVYQVENPVEGFVSHAQDNDLAVTDMNEQGEWEGWIRGDASLDALRTWPGGFLVNATSAVALPRPWWQKTKSWLNPKVTQFEGEELERDADESSLTSLDYLVLITIAAILAAFGLVLNSSAVIIGAMLVAPLMTPLIAFATGIAIGKIKIMRQAAGTLLQGIFAALLVAFIVGWLSSTNIVTAEMAGRGNVTFLDMGVALASGFIGAYAKTRSNIASSLAGVAIAAALMPPLVTVGLAISFGEWALAEGASLLFLTNIVSITLAAWITLFWLGLRPGKEGDPTARRRASTLMVILLVAVLAGINLRSIDTVAAGRIENSLRDSFRQAELVNYEIRQSDPLEVIATVRQPAGNLDDSSEIIVARDSLEELLGKPVKLSVVLEPLVDADVAAANVEFEAQIDRILRQTIQSGELVESIFIPGNPTIVFALISTDADLDSEPLASEIQAAEAALSEAAGLPVELQVLTTGAEVGEEVESSNAAFAETIEKILNESLRGSELVSFTFEVGNPFVVEATIRTELDQSSDEFLANIEATEDALAAALGIPVLLDVTVQSPAIVAATPTTTGAGETAPAPTEELPAATEELPAATEELPAATGEPPTATEEPPTVTEESPTVTDEPPTVTEEPAPTVESSPTP